MDEGSKDKEVKNTISDLFPLKKQSVVAAFETLNLDEEKQILSKTNPHVLTSFEEFLEYYSKKNAEQMLFGALVCHRALREEARVRGGALPTFTERFIEDYDDQAQSTTDKSAEEALYHKKLSPEQTGREFSRQNIVVFRNKEPDFSKIVERELGAQPNWLPEEDFRYRGLIDQYLIFRKGCSDPKNFQIG